MPVLPQTRMIDTSSYARFDASVIMHVSRCPQQNPLLLTLSLLMFWIFADYHYSAFSFNYFALFANLFY